MSLAFDLNGKDQHYLDILEQSDLAGNITLKIHFYGAELFDRGQNFDYEDKRITNNFNNFIELLNNINYFYKVLNYFKQRLAAQWDPTNSPSSTPSTEFSNNNGTYIVESNSTDRFDKFVIWFNDKTTANLLDNQNNPIGRVSNGTNQNLLQINYDYIKCNNLQLNFDTNYPLFEGGRRVYTDHLEDTFIDLTKAIIDIGKKLFSNN